MPLLIQHIDAIAREKQRDVLYIRFVEPARHGSKELEEAVGQTGDWQRLPIRQTIIDWLEAHGISWVPCGHYANVNEMRSYQGQIYIDLPYDNSLPQYRELESFLENEDGSMRFPEAQFCYLPLEVAMQNAEHDEPGFWERWAENF